MWWCVPFFCGRRALKGDDVCWQKGAYDVDLFADGRRAGARGEK